MSRYVSLEQLPEEYELKPGVTVGALIGILTAVAADIGLQTIYKTTITYEAPGNNFMANTLYYRFDNPGPFDNPFVGADHLAYQIKQEVVPVMRSALRPNVLIKDVRITPYTPLFGIKLLNPYVEQIGVSGSRGNAVAFDTERFAANLRMNVQAVGFDQWVQQMLGLLPKSGRIYFGPLGDDLVGGNESLSPDGIHVLQPLAEKLADRLVNASPAGTFVPLRVARHGFDVPVLGHVNVFTGWADVMTCSPLSETVMLKSRDS